MEGRKWKEGESESDFDWRKPWAGGEALSSPARTMSISMLFTFRNSDREFPGDEEGGGGDICLEDDGEEEEEEGEEWDKCAKDTGRDFGLEEEDDEDEEDDERGGEV